MIASFRHKGLRRLFEEDDASKVPSELRDRIARLLAALDEAQTLGALDRPSLRLHPLRGNLRDHWAIAVNGNWRIVFRFEDGRALDVDLLDYH